jgi:hypothetical protein
MEAVRTSETSVENHFTRQYIPEDNSEQNRKEFPMGKSGETVLDRIEARKLRWFGHVMRMPEERWTAIIHSWIPPGRKKRGRPRRS